MDFYKFVIIFISLVHVQCISKIFNNSILQLLFNVTLRLFPSLSLSLQTLVGVTCHSVDHALLQDRPFDYCIMDEASQIPLPLSLAPLRLASRFILVGDHYQLPPLVKSQVAK